MCVACAPSAGKMKHTPFVLCWLGSWSYFFTLSHIFIGGVNTLRNVKVIIPEAVFRGENIKLVCLYDLEGDILYTVKWYKGREEFYRYVPKEAPPIKVFPLRGIQVDTWMSNAHQVLLRNAQPDLTDRFRCEVSADAPSFHTEIVSAQMTVVEFPDDRPIIQVERTKYEVGERVRANCTFPGSIPAANLTWLVHDSPVPRQYLNKYLVEPGRDLRQISRLGLELDTDGSSFREGKLRLKCVASIFSRFQRVSEVGLDEEKPRSASVLGSKESPAAPKRGKGCISQPSGLLLALLLLIALKR